MSASSDSEDYSSRVISKKNKKNDENFMSCKNDFIKDFQNRSHIPNVVQTSISKANGSFVNDPPKRKRDQLEESENYLNSIQTKKKKMHHSNEVDVEESEPDDFVTVRADHKNKSKKKSHTVPDADELDVSSRNLESESSSKKHKKSKTLSLPGESNLLEVESVGIEQEQAVPHKKHKKSKKQSKIESETSSSGKKRNSIITSTQVDKSSLPPQDLNESSQSLLDFEQKNLSIQNIGSEVSEDELGINELIQNVKLNLQLPKKSSKKVTSESENLTKPTDPAHILKNFERNNLSFKKVNFENDSLHNLKGNRPCFIVKVPVDLDPHQLIGKSISVDKKKRMAIGTRDYVTSLRDREVKLVFLEKNNGLLRLEVSRIVTVKPTSKTNVLLTKEIEILDDLISEPVTSVGSSNEKKSPTKNVQSNTDQLDRFLKDGAKVLEDVKRVRILFDLEKQTNSVLQKQVKFLHEQNTSTAEYKKIKKELEKETRELLHKRVNIMNSNKLSD